MHATYSKTITEADIVLFAGVSGDKRNERRAPSRSTTLKYPVTKPRVFH